MAKYDKSDLERRMKGAVEALKGDLSGLRTGSAESFQRVPRLSVQPSNSLPKPTEKASARTPNRRATR